MGERVVIAIGGNAILHGHQKGTFDEQMDNIAKTIDPIIGLVKNDYHIVLTHGNGPQVGNILIQNEMAGDFVPASPLDVCVAKTQGQIGYMLEMSLRNAFHAAGVDTGVICALTHVEVQADDEAFQNPTKPVGPFFTKEEAESLVKAKGYRMIQDSGRGYRRIVPSPMPRRILESGQIGGLLENNVVIAGGGGGIPVTREGGRLKGVSAVIDKDFASAILAVEIKADILIILTGVKQVYINFGKENQQAIDALTAEQARAYIGQGQFPAGSMLPKIEAALLYLEQGGKEVIITDIGYLAAALKGKCGTRITN